MSYIKNTDVFCFFSWEYPNHQGIGCNVISSSDSFNFLSFLQELRQNPVGSTLILSSAVGLIPYAGSDGSPMTDVSAFAEYLDWIGKLFGFVLGTIPDHRRSHHGLRRLGFLVYGRWPQRPLG